VFRHPNQKKKEVTTLELTVYWAGPLFSQAERSWNRTCVRILSKRGYRVILPQDEAKPFVRTDGLDGLGIAEHCCQQVIACHVMVAIVDGPDPDSGTSLEVGIRIGYMLALGKQRKIICVRTDFRGSEDGHLNAMFNLADRVVYVPSFNEDPTHLIDVIENAIKQLT